MKVWRAMSVRTSSRSASAASAGTKWPVCGACGSGGRARNGIFRLAAHQRRAADPIAVVPGGFDGLDETSVMLADAQSQPLSCERPVRRIEIGGDQPRLPAGVAAGAGQQEARQGRQLFRSGRQFQFGLGRDLSLPASRQTLEMPTKLLPPRCRPVEDAALSR